MDSDPQTGGLRPVGTVDPDGTVFRLVEYGPGVTPRNHRTESVDYAVVLEGEITLLLDDSDVVLRAGDVVIQRGTNHAWSNRSGKPVRMLYILIDGKFEPPLAAQFKSAK